jgi:transcriptional regulator with XRE-family HTH domain
MTYAIIRFRTYRLKEYKNMAPTTINPKALRALRDRKKLTRQQLAEECSLQGSRVKISLRSITRYEKGETQPSPKKAECLAKALGTTVARLRTEPQDDAVSNAILRDLGYARVSALLSPDEALNYSVVAHHYGLPPAALIANAPWMYTLLAEMSLADRKQRLSAARTALAEAVAHLPGHLWHAYDGHYDFESAYGEEKDSIDNRDIFGKIILETERAGTVPFDPAETNPFVDFLSRKATEIGSSALNSEDCNIGNLDLPSWPIFKAWVDELTGNDWLATHAVKGRHVKLNAIPLELQGPEKCAERVAWLIDQIPADERARLEEERRAALEEDLFAVAEDLSAEEAQ